MKTLAATIRLDSSAFQTALKRPRPIILRSLAVGGGVEEEEEGVEEEEGRREEEQVGELKEKGGRRGSVGTM